MRIRLFGIVVLLLAAAAVDANSDKKKVHKRDPPLTGGLVDPPIAGRVVDPPLGGFLEQAKRKRRGNTRAHIRELLLQRFNNENGKAEQLFPENAETEGKRGIDVRRPFFKRNMNKNEEKRGHMGHTKRNTEFAKLQKEGSILEGKVAVNNEGYHRRRKRAAEPIENAKK